MFFIKLPFAGLNEQNVTLFEGGVGLRAEAFKLVAHFALFCFQPVKIGQPNIALDGKLGGVLLPLLFDDGESLLTFTALLFHDRQGLLAFAALALIVGPQGRNHRKLRLHRHLRLGQDRTEQIAQVAQLFLDLFRRKIGRGFSFSRGSEPGMQALGRCPDRTVALQRCPLGMMAQLGGQEPVGLNRSRRRATGQGQAQFPLNPAQIGPPVTKQMVIGHKDPRRVSRIALSGNHIARPEQQRFFARKAVTLGQRGRDLERIAHHHHIARHIARLLQRRAPEPAEH